MRRWGHSGGQAGYTPVEPPAITVSWVWAGNVSDSAATVLARSTDASAVTLRYSTSSDLSGFSTVVGTEGSDDVWKFDLPALSPDTRYYYGFAGSDVTGTFRTFPTVGTAYDFAIWAASCAGHSGGEYVDDDVSNAPTFDVIRARLESGELIGGVHMGDRHYRDIGSNNQTSFRNAYNDVMAASRQRLLHEQGWMDYHWDDHDFGPNDSHAGSASKPAAQAVYRTHVPHWTLPDDEGIYHTYVIGRVRFIILDVRSYRSTNGSTDNSSKTMLGATQKAWALDIVDNATEPCIVIFCGSPWNGDDSITWGSFSTERDELIGEFTTLGKKDRLFMVHGDNHFLAFDDGTNAPGGIPTAQLAALDAGFTTNDGTWTSGIVKAEQQQYGILAFTDTGSQITVTVTGISVDSSSDETEEFSEDVVYPG
ncbi:MAG: alkaline phosphatase D family protein [Chloroflexi bacterium]|nr:alkaline phosphatase D family protein [Chloroflexota bacterium]